MSGLKDLNLNVSLSQFPELDSYYYDGVDKPIYNAAEIANKIIFGNKNGHEHVTNNTESITYHGLARSKETITYSLGTDLSNLDQYNKKDTFGDNSIAGSENLYRSLMTETQKDYFRKSLQVWDDLIAADFQEIDANDSNADTADIIVNNVDLSLGNVWGYTYIGTDSETYQGEEILEMSQSTIWIFDETSDGSNSYDGVDDDGNYDFYSSYNYLAAMHEFGHALGLEHPGDYDAQQGEFNYDEVAEFAQDTYAATIMSYFYPSLDNIDWGYYLPSTPMVYDILAIQFLYGADTGTRTEDNIYGVSLEDGGTESFEGKVWSVWDAGGIDTFDFSHDDSDQYINLNQGSYSDVYGLKSNIGIAFGTIIENVILGSGDDIIVGNEVDNHIDGGDGYDYYSTRSSISDTTLAYDQQNDTIIVTSTDGGVDTLSNVEVLCFGAIGDYNTAYVIIATGDPDLYSVTLSSDGTYEAFYNGDSVSYNIPATSQIFFQQQALDGQPVDASSLQTIEYYYLQQQEQATLNLSGNKLPENSSFYVVGEITISDVSDLSDYTFSITSSNFDSASSFSIETLPEGNGYYLVFRAASDEELLDFESFFYNSNSISLKIVAKKTGAPEVSSHVSVEITDIDEAPRFSEAAPVWLSSFNKLATDTNGGDYIKFFVNDDGQENGNLNFSLSDERFEVVKHPMDGYILKLKDDQSITADEYKSLSVHIVASDALGNSTLKTFTVKTDGTSSVASDISALEFSGSEDDTATLGRHQLAGYRLALLSATESSESGSLSYSILGTSEGAEWFEIIVEDNLVYLALKKDIDASEDITSINVHIQAHNDQGGSLAKTFTVNLTDKDIYFQTKDGTSKDLALQVSEATPAMDTVGNYIHLIDFTVEGDFGSDELTLTVSDIRFGLSYVNGEAYLFLKEDGVLDYETEQSLEVTVFALVNNQPVYSQKVMIEVQNTDDEAPTFSIISQEEVFDTSGALTEVVLASFTVSDKDTSGEITPTLSIKDEFGYSYDDLIGDGKIFYLSKKGTTYSIIFNRNGVSNLNGINELIVTLNATDGLNNSDDYRMVFDVQNSLSSVNEAADNFVATSASKSIKVSDEIIDIYTPLVSGLDIANFTISDSKGTSHYEWEIFLLDGGVYRQTDAFVITDNKLSLVDASKIPSEGALSLLIKLTDGDGANGAPVYSLAKHFSLFTNSSAATSAGTRQLTNISDSYTFVGGESTMSFAGGDDVIYSKANNASAKLDQGNDRFFGNGLSQSIEGGTGDDKIAVIIGNSTLRGGDDNDLLVGGTGDDELYGNSGNDYLSGDFIKLPFFGDDRLTGGKGDDYLMGGRGADIFVFNPDDGRDTIARFDVSALWQGGAMSSQTLSKDFDILTDKISLQGFGYSNVADFTDHLSLINGQVTFSDQGTIIVFYGHSDLSAFSGVSIIL